MDQILVNKKYSTLTTTILTKYQVHSQAANTRVQQHAIQILIVLLRWI